MRQLILALLLACHEVEPETQPWEEPGTPVAPTSTQEVPPSKLPPAPPQIERLLTPTTTTKFKAGPKFESRVTNITKIAELLDGLRLHPGEEFSFNQRVGPRTLERGFKNASTFFMGEVIEGVGGGTCQVSSTLYTAVLYANVKVLERRPHSRVSSYLPPGLDATVNYPAECWDAQKPDKKVCYDLKFKNPYDFDLVFKVEVETELDKDEKRALTVNLLGTGQVPLVATRWRTVTTPPFETRHRQVSWWKDDRKLLAQPGKPGLTGVLDVKVNYPDGREELTKVRSQYEPVPEVWKVGMAWVE